MKIMCQEHYDKVVHYAKELGDESLQACLAKLRSWEEHSHRPCEIELYRDFPPLLVPIQAALYERHTGHSRRAGIPRFARPLGMLHYESRRSLADAYVNVGCRIVSHSI